MLNVVNRLRQISHKDISDVLDREQKLLPSLESTSSHLQIEPESDGTDQEYYFFACRVLPGKYTLPHFHKAGNQYFFFFSIGELNIGTIHFYSTRREVRWERNVVHPDGGVVVVLGDHAHSFWNTGDLVADFVFACPLAHFETDFFFTEDFKDGIPPWYPKR